MKCNCTVNFDNFFDILAADSNKFILLLRESRLMKRNKQGDKIVSVRALWLRQQFYFYYHMTVRAFLIYGIDFNKYLINIKIDFNK